jgi:type I restriction enzyme R subunit
MYLDKPMRDHTLLQAIARVNRPYETEGEIKKPSGFVLDFVGIFDKLEKALAFDSDVVAGVIENIDVLKDRFKAVMETEAPLYLDLASGTRDDKLVEKIQDYFLDPAKQEAFRKFYKELETLYEIISPDPFLRDFLDHYATLAEVYSLMLVALSADRPVGLRDLMNKTEELVREQVTAGGLTQVLPLYEINEKTLEALKKDGGSDSAKVVNLARSLAVAVREREDEQPYLIPIGERAAHVLELFEDKQLSTQQALEALQKSLDEYNAAQRELEERGFDINTFSYYWFLRRAGVDEALSLAPAIDEAFGRFPNFRENADERRDAKAELYKVLLPHVAKASRSRLVDEVMKVRRR